MSSLMWTCIKLMVVGAVLFLGGILYYNVSTKDTIEIRLGLIDLYLQSKLSKFFFGADVKMKDVKLTWRRADENFFLYAKGVKILDKNLGISVDVPEFSIYSKVGILFLWGDWGDSRIEMPKITASFYESFKDVGNVKNSDGYVRGSLPFSISSIREKLFTFFKSNVPIAIDSLVLNGANGDSIALDSLHFGAEKEYDGRVFSLGFLGEDSSSVSVQLTEHYRDVVSLHVRYDHFDTALLKYLAFLDERLDLYSNLVISGTADVVLDANGHIEYGDINLHSLKGVVPYGTKEIAVQKFRGRARYSDRKLLITDFHLTSDELVFRMRASLDSVSGQLDVSIGGYEVNVKRICDYWPETFNSGARDWYCEHVEEGFFREPQISFHGLIHEISNPTKYRVSSHVKDAVVRINGKYGNVRIVDGGMLFNNGDLTIRSEDYNLLGIRAREGIAVFKDVGSEDARLEVRGSAVNSAKELYEIFDIASVIGSEIRDISGDATTRFTVTISNLRNDHEVKSNVRVTSRINELDADGILDIFGVRNVDLDFAFDDGSINLAAVGKMNSRDMTFHVKRDTSDGTGDDAIVRYEFDGYISGSDLQKLSPAAHVFDVGGYSKARIKWVGDRNSTGSSKLYGALDLSTLTLGKEYFKLDNKQEGTLEFLATIYKGGDINVDYARIEGQDLSLSLRGKIGKNIDLTADKIKFLATDAKAHIKSTDGNVDIRLFGKVLDLRKANLGHFFGGESTMKNSAINLQVENVLMNNGVVMEEFDFKFLRSDSGTAFMKVVGRFEEDGSRLSIEYGPRGLEVMTDDAGSFLKAINVLNTVEGGRLSVYMYPGGKNGKTQGIFSLTRFNVVNAPILAQILTLSSLQGINNTLRGEGIHFSKLNVPFNYENNMISFKESWMEGVELGISMGGGIDLGTRNFDVRGQIIPAYAVNKMVWSTPFVGKLLTGGHSRGIVAVDYKVKGTAKVHDIAVNLLSILTPNLLKRALKVLDYKMMKQEKEENTEAAANKAA